MSWALKSERVGRFRKLAGTEFQTVGAMKLKERANRSEIAFRDFQELFARSSEGA